MRFLCSVFFLLSSLALTACGDEPSEKTTSKTQSSAASEASQPSTQSQSVSAIQSAGGVTVNILPENPENSVFVPAA